ncbi:unnamed protein product [Thlaspi arvense]|uniref:Uncharacterized protein n=1 Tax=Thlaspi arvense TaxID=13288 RepID=A0AAU9RGZ6_THLAR|nr:unnamed protein product [Thlaspi arvense]
MLWHKEEQGLTTNRSSVSEFGDDNFSVGSWEKKEVISRDGDVKLQTQIFYASIDQRSEQAAGESACTALVAVIADWFHCNSDQMPIKSQLDSLIQEGSLEWRNLCEDVAYTMRFLTSTLTLRLFSRLKMVEQSGRFDLLHGAMSFDSIWDEISKNNETTLYIVSWNDHFFILKVEMDAYYIVDTLGERLYEGCNQAYILKFDEETTMSHVCKEAQSSEKKPASEETKMVALNESQDSEEEEEESVLCRGKECCKEYIKKFLAAIPTRELQVDLKKGLMASIPLHHRLQIEFHYTRGCKHELISSPYKCRQLLRMSSYLIKTVESHGFVFKEAEMWACDIW